MSNTPIPFTPADAGCYVDGHSGHYGNLNVVRLAQSCGFTMSAEDAALCDRYDAENHLPTYPFEAFVEGPVLDAEAYLNTLAPEGFVFAWEDGEFFLSSLTADDHCNDHGLDECPDCGNTGTAMGKSGYYACTRFVSCWTD